MVYKGIVSDISSGGDLVTVTPFSGGIVTPWLVLPFYLIGGITVGTEVVYTLFSDNTGIVLHRADGSGSLDTEV